MSAELKATDQLSQLPEPDVIIAHQNVCAEDMREQFPRAPMIFSAHGVVPVHERPPKCSVQAYTAINEDTLSNLVSWGVDPVKIELVRDFVDTSLFKCYVGANEILHNVLFISNFHKGETYSTIVKACDTLHLHLRAVGAPYGRSRHIEEDINKADLVISTGRGVLEAMSCARPVISYGQGRGDGYLKPEVYMRSRTRNFAGDKCLYTFDAHQLAREMGLYSRADGEVNRMFVFEHHDVRRGVDKLLEISERCCGR